MKSRRVSVKARVVFQLFGVLLTIHFSLFTRPAFGQVLVPVSDTLYNADGSKASGRIVISWDPFTTADNTTVDGGTLSYTIPASGVNQGKIDVSLAPNAGATPSGTSYRVRYYLTNGASYTETWVVPASGPVAIRQVRVLPPTPVPASTYLTMLNGLTAATQTLSSVNDTNATLAITSTGGHHQFALGWTGALALPRGGTSQTAWTASRCVRVNNAGTALESAASDCGAGGGGGYGTIQDDGSVLSQRSTLNFVGGAITASDDSANNRTNVTLSIADSDIPASFTRDSEVNVQGTANEITSSGSGTAPTLSLPSTLDLSGKTLKGASPLVFDGATANANKTSVAVADPTAARTFTIPNADTVAVQPLTCSGTDKVSSISAARGVTCAADQTGGGSSHNLLSTTHSDTTAGTVARGDLIVGQGTTPTWQRLAVGAANRFLGSDGTDASWTAPSGGGAVLGAGRAINTSGAALSGGGDFSADRTITLSESPNSTSVVGTGRALTGGAGIAAIGDLTADRTIATASDEADFLKFGALTCGASTQGKMQVHTTPLEYCDNAATPTLQYSAHGDSSGNAKTGDSATAFFTIGQLEPARGGTGADSSGSSGVPKVAAGTWSFNANIADLASSPSANLASVLTDETGSGKVVFDTTPTFTTSLTTPAVISTASDPADAGVIRLGNNEVIGWEANPTGTDLTLKVDTNNVLTASVPVNATTGFRIGNTASSGRYLKGDGTNFVQSAGSASGVGSCTNQAVTGLNSDAAPTCTTVTSAYVDSTVVTNSNTNTLTNKTIDAEATGNVISQPVKIEFVAAGCDNATAASGFDLPTSNSPAKTSFGTSPHRFGALDFADGASVLTASTRYLLPADWTSTCGADIKFIWFSGSTSTNGVAWTVQTVCVADGEDVLNPTYNTAQTVSKANNATANTRNSAAITGITMTGCAAGEMLYLKIGRDPTNGSDTLAATASLQSVEVTIRRQM